MWGGRERIFSAVLLLHDACTHCDTVSIGFDPLKFYLPFCPISSLSEINHCRQLKPIRPIEFGGKD